MKNKRKADKELEERMVKSLRMNMYTYYIYPEEEHRRLHYAWLLGYNEGKKDAPKNLRHEKIAYKPHEQMTGTELIQKYEKK